MRPNAPGLIIEGKSFREAFESKYLDGHSTTPSRAEGILDAEEAPTTTSQFYKTASNFEVEVVLSEKVAARFRQLGRLREAGLEWESVGRAYDTVDSQTEESLHDFGQKLSGENVSSFSARTLLS